MFNEGSIRKLVYGGGKLFTHPEAFFSFVRKDFYKKDNNNTCSVTNTY